MRPSSERWRSARLALLALAYYSCVFCIKASMFACSWTQMPTFFGGLNYKTCLALAQTFGYAAGKIPSLIYSPKLPQERLRGALIAVLVVSGSCVTLSCVTPPWVSLCLVWLACVWLAPTWSILQRFLEGRRDTERIVATVSFAYIGSAGLCKGAAVDLLALGLTDTEAVAACAIFGTVVGVAAALGVAAQPPPSAADIEKRGRRQAMTSYRDQCGHLQAHFGFGITLCVAGYTILGSLRAYRDYFQVRRRGRFFERRRREGGSRTPIARAPVRLARCPSARAPRLSPLQLELFQAVGLAAGSSHFAASEVRTSDPPLGI